MIRGSVASCRWPLSPLAWPRILAGVLVLVVVLAALGRRRALRESETES
jgi:hypothetical protein